MTYNFKWCKVILENNNILFSKDVLQCLKPEVKVKSDDYKPLRGHSSEEFCGKKYHCKRGS
jgi:hypothetical protein